MKKSLIVFLFLAFLTPAFALLKNVTVTSGAVVLLVTPAPQATFVTIKNTGSVAVRVTWDGGTANGGTNPTTTSGDEILPGEKIILTTSASVYSSQISPIYAIAESSSTTIAVTTNDTHST